MTRLYFMAGTGDGAEWTDKRALARDFAKSFKALKFVQEQDLEHMEIVLTFGARELDLTIAAERLCCPPPRRPPEHPFL